MEQVPVRPDGLQLNEDRGFQERYWTVERIAWAVFALILIAALAGLSGGGGPISKQRVAVAGGHIVAPRIARWAAADRLEVTFPSGAERHSVSLGPEFLQSFQIETITPAPENAVALAGGIRLEFETTDGPASATLHVRPDGVGRAAYRATVDETETVEITTWIVP